MFATRIKHGVVGGLVGGLVFGIMMGMMGMLPMIGKMIGQPNAIAGFLLHMVISAGIGAGFGLVLGRFVKGGVSGLTFGSLYGAAWWFLGPLTLMPAMMGMGVGVNWTTAAMGNMLPSLYGHLIFGAVTGFVYNRGENCFLVPTRRDPEIGNDEKAEPTRLEVV